MMARFASKDRTAPALLLLLDTATLPSAWTSSSRTQAATFARGRSPMMMMMMMTGRRMVVVNVAVVVIDSHGSRTQTKGMDGIV